MVKKGGFISNLNVIIKYLKSDLIKKQRSFKIGLVSVFLVVFFLTLLLNAIQLCPSIFIKLSEEQNSEIDLLLTPYLTRKNVDIKKSGFDTLIYNKISLTNALTTNYKINFNFLNFYEINEKLENIPFIEGLSPRWIIQGKASNKNEKKKIFSEFLTNIIILDSSIENNIGIGRSLNLPTLQKNECYISTTLGNALKLDIGDIVQINIKLWDLIQAFEGGSPNEKEEEEYNKTIKDRIKLKDIYEKEDNISINNEKFYKDIFEPENDFHIGKKFFGSNRYKNVKNAILNSKPIKEIINIIANEIINKIINENINKLLKLINEYFPNNINLNDLSSFSVKKSELKNLMDLIVDENVKSIFGNMISNFTNMNNSRISSNINLIKNITNSLLKQTFTYNETTDLIEFNKTLLSISPKGNITNYIKYNLDYHKILEQYNKESSDPIFDEAFKFSNFKINLTVREKIKPTSGKWPSSLGNVLAIDCNYISDYLEINSKRLVEELGDSLNIESGKKIILNYTNKYIKNFDINKYALTINGIFKNKFEIYTKDRKDLKKYISKKASEITKFLGLNHQVNIELPLYKNIIYFEVLIIFLKVILMGIMFFLWILSVLLVYSLMLGNVDERTYESSMLRALGFKKNNLIFLIVIQGLFFAIPGTLLGLVSSYIANNYIAFLFNSYTKLVMPFFMSKSNLIFGIIIGISIPLISSYFPIKKVLNRNLKDSLTIFNKKIGDISISMIKLEKMGISPITLITSIILIVIGLLTYYVAPISFIFLNPKIFLFIMLGILITMLLGLIILTQLFVPYLQKFILKIIMFFSFKDRKLHLIVTKNLDGHKRRDMQISLMFMIALGFVIFSGCTLNLVVDFIETMAKNIIGGDFMIILTNKSNFNATLNQTSINGYLNNITNNYPNLIQDYAYISYPFEDIFLTKDHKIYPTLSTLNGFPDKQTRVYAIDKNFIDSSYTSLYSISQYDKNLNVSYTNDGKVDIIKMLYDNPNVPITIKENEDSFIFPKNINIQSKFNKIFKDFQLNMIVAEGIRRARGININNPTKYQISQIYEHSIPGKIVGMARKIPGIHTYSSYYSIARESEAFISMDHMKKLIDCEIEFFNINLGDYSNSTVDGIRKIELVLKYKNLINKELKEMIYFAMNNYLIGVKYFMIKLDDIIETSEKVKEVIGYIFLVLGIIALILSFFLIWISFYSNIRENITEYGIMRSIGVTKKQSIRIYLYEAASIILTSIIFGTFIGVIISCSLILQFDIFLELPFIFHFPYLMYFILIIVGLLLGLLGSYYPIYSINSLTLVNIMKGFNE